MQRKVFGRPIGFFEENRLIWLSKERYFIDEKCMVELEGEKKAQQAFGKNRLISCPKKSILETHEGISDTCIQPLVHRQKEKKHLV